MSGKVFSCTERTAKNTVWTAGHIIRALGDLLMPRHCIVCDRQLLVGERHLCIWCQDDLPLTYFWLQSRNPMADKFNLMIQRRLESAQAKEHEPYAFAIALFYYKSQTGYRKITQSLKYHGDLSAGRDFARSLGHKIGLATYLRKVDLVVPVPLHWTRRWSRGYNQAEIIAGEVAKVVGGTMVPDLLVRNRRTRTQTKLSVGKKAENVKGAFSVNPKRSKLLKGPVHLLLIDDVFTTGATLNACYTALREWQEKAGGQVLSIRISIATLGYVG